MKKIIIAIGVLVILAVAGLGMRFMLRGSDLATENRMENATSTGMLASATSTSATRNVGDPLQSIATKILDRPVMVSADLSGQTKQLALQKIKESSDMLRENYDYANPWYDLGSYRKLIGDYTGAVDAWSFVSRIRPNDFISLHDLGDLYAFLKNYPQAEQYFLASIDKNPENVDAYVQVSAIYQYNDTAKSALIKPLLLRGIAANPGAANLKITLGEYYQRTGNITAARNYLEQALKLNPGNMALRQELDALGK